MNLKRLLSQTRKNSRYGSCILYNSFT